MSMGSGKAPRDEGRRGVRSGSSGTRRPFVDTGWNDYDPAAADAPGVASRRICGTEDRRNYKSSRSGGVGTVLRFTAFTLVLASLVLGGLYFFARPALFHAIADWGAENPTALELPFVADIVRSDLGSSLTEPVDVTDARQIVFQIKYGETTAQIGDALVQAGVIADARAFVFQAIERDQTVNFQAGRHIVTRAMTVDQAIDALVSPPVSPPTVRLLFVEGLRIEQMVAKLEYLEANPTDPGVKLTLDVEQYYELATNPPADLVAHYPWLKLPPGASLEGFLFPATYDVSPDLSALGLIEQQLDAFANHAPAGLLALPPDQIYQTVQIAALVEHEVKLDSDRPLVAGVYVNRLDLKKWPTGLLDSNPTVSYANDSVWLKSHPIDAWVGYTFWLEVGGTTPLAQIVFPETIAPYNTYHHAGLPPTPICSPGAASIQAALAPDTADGYYYFLAKNDGTGGLAFAHTNAEQVANEKKYGYIK
ncbi:MAG: endolytic transglycosylase MltG [Candidatus Limnocylindrales bacterium]|jgi:UPF0755 protein